jgi:hypothetical protein
MKNYDPKRRDSTWRMIQPGCYVDPAGRAHIFPDEVLAFLREMHPNAGFDPASRSDYDLVVETYRRTLQAMGYEPQLIFIEHERIMN